MRTCVRALGQPDRRERAATRRCRGSDRRSSGPSTRPRRSAPASTRSGPLRDQRGARALADAVPVHDQSVPGLQPCLCLLLRPPHAHLPGPERPRGLRARDRRQGERARGGARRAGRRIVGRRARRARDQHRSLSVGREPLPADGGDLGGDARLREPLLGADQVAAAPARHRGDEGARRGRRSSSANLSMPTIDEKARGARPSPTPRTRASGSRRCAS